jgi:hypothetical protein
MTLTSNLNLSLKNVIFALLTSNSLLNYGQNYSQPIEVSQKLTDLPISQKHQHSCKLLYEKLERQHLEMTKYLGGERSKSENYAKGLGFTFASYFMASCLFVQLNR